MRSGGRTDTDPILMEPDLSSSFILVLSCPDRKGIVAAVANFLAGHDASITDSSQFNDATDQFYMRVDFVGERGMALASIKAAFAPIAQAYRMHWTLYDKRVKPRILIAVSKFGHCLYDLIHRWRSGLLPVEIAAIVSNHDDMRGFVEWSGIPFHRLPESKGAQEQAILDHVKTGAIELVVLARYMLNSFAGTLCYADRTVHQHPPFLLA